ncbi:hypothetical protein ACJJTC_018509, partial [Scirpophaga incertulas]
NVLIRNIGDDNYMAVVADFGLAAKIPPSVNGYRLPSVGSPWWMSPECLRGRWYDHRSDIFSYGIILCQLIARVDADPDVLPRTDNFGLNYTAFVELCDDDTQPDFLRLAFNCCIFEPKERPLFPEIVSRLADIKDGLEDVSWGCHTPNNSYERSVHSLGRCLFLSAGNRRRAPGRAPAPACPRPRTPRPVSTACCTALLRCAARRCGLQRRCKGGGSGPRSCPRPAAPRSNAPLLRAFDVRLNNAAAESLDGVAQGCNRLRPSGPSLPDARACLAARARRPEYCLLQALLRCAGDL